MKTQFISKIKYSKFKEFSPHQSLIMFKFSAAALFIGIVFKLTSSLNDNSIQQFDQNVLIWVETLRSPFLNSMMLDITALGGLALTIVLGVLSILLFLLSKDRAGALHLTLTAVGGFFISSWAKNLILRPRPSIIPSLIKVSGFSYPSGHAVTSACLYLTMAILACRHFKSHKSRVLLLIMAGMMISLISFSRIYLGVHYPSDTLSGAFIGLSWALLTAALFTKTHFGKSKSL